MMIICCSRKSAYSLPFLLLSIFSIFGFFSVHSSDISQLSNLGNHCSYRDIGDMYMRSFGLDESPEQQQTEEDSKKIKFVELTENEKRTILFNILAESERKQAGEIKTDDLLRTVFEDLEFFYAPGREHCDTLFAHLNNTHTLFGEAVLAKIIANPIIDAEQLRKRQVFIKELVSNEQFFNELEKLMVQMHSAETNILSFWKDEHQIAQAAINKLYFSKPGFRKLNTSALALETQTRVQNIITGLMISGDFLLAVCLHKLLHRQGIGGLLQPCSWGRSFRDVGRWVVDCWNPKSWYDSYRQIYSNEFANQLGLYLDEQEIERGLRRARKAVVGTLIFEGILFGAYATWRAFGIKNAVSAALQDKNIQLYLQRRLIDVATLVSSVEKMEQLAACNQCMKEGLLSLSQSLNIFDKKSRVSAEAKRLVELLQTWSFRGTPSFFSSAGRILAAHTLIGSAKDELICAMEAIGEVDACLSIAKLYKKHANAPVRYSFAEYVESEKPYINAKGFWNPIVDSAVAVPNDLILGGDQSVRNGIVTGSNTGGKSTALKAVSISVLLAQTFGIVPAQEFVMTPFEFITTSFNIKDDTVAGDSLYKAEVMRAKKLVEVARKLGRGQHAFFAIDELFTGTSPEKGQEAAYTVALRLARIPGVCYLWATHYPRLTQLEQDTNSVCKNYKMEAFRDEQTGQIIRPFKLEEGISSSNVAIDILERELDEKPTDDSDLSILDDENEF